MWVLCQMLTPQSISFASLAFHLWLVCFLPSPPLFSSCPGHEWLVHLPYMFLTKDSSAPSAPPQHWGSSESDKTKASPLSYSSGKSPNRSQKNLHSLRIRAVLFSLILGTCTGNVSCLKTITHVSSMGQDQSGLKCHRASWLRFSYFFLD